VDGLENPTFEAIRRKEVVGVGRDMHYVVERNGQRLTFDITPVVTNQSQGGGGTTGWGPQMDVQIAGPCCGVDAIQKAGLKSGDTFVSMNGQPIRASSRLVDIVEKSDGKPIDVVYSRAGMEYETTITPAWSTDDGTGRWRIGAALQSPVEIVQLPFRAAVAESLDENGKNALMLYKFLQGIVEQRMSPKSIDGPLRIAQLSGEAARQGATSFLNLMAMVSLNLAVVNLLPIPLLDGGGILMLLIEMLMQRDLSMRVKEGIVKVGFAFLMMVIVFVLYNDISKTFSGG
jgi:regulator of sigma E protease